MGFQSPKKCANRIPIPVCSHIGLPRQREYTCAVLESSARQPNFVTVHIERHHLRHDLVLIVHFSSPTRRCGGALLLLPTAGRSPDYLRTSSAQPVAPFLMRPSPSHYPMQPIPAGPAGRIVQFSATRGTSAQ